VDGGIENQEKSLDAVPHLYRLSGVSIHTCPEEENPYPEDLIND
jgi:hypothetical protein